MSARLDYRTVSPEAVKPLLAMEAYVANSSLDRLLVHLVKMRASQLNGCAFCLDMHSKDARADGETEQRLYALDAWRETPFYSDRERAALEWTEALTFVGQTHAPDDTYRAVRAHFTERELIDLTLAIVAINSWNRICIGFRVEPGQYQPANRDTRISAGSAH